MSVNGIPKLRKKAKTDLKLKGKGHEVCTTLWRYMFWVDTI